MNVLGSPFSLVDVSLRKCSVAENWFVAMFLPERKSYSVGTTCLKEFNTNQSCRVYNVFALS